MILSHGFHSYRKQQNRARESEHIYFPFSFAFPFLYNIMFSAALLPSANFFVLDSQVRFAAEEINRGEN